MAAGLRYQWSIPGKRPHTILQTIGNGCAFLDYDNDGNLDILLIGPKPALYQGDGHGHFRDTTREARLDRLSGNFLGCAVADVDGDGYPDVYITAYRGGVLLHNEAFRPSGAQAHANPEHRLFRDVTREAGIAPQPWGTSAAFAETTPGSGRLDLYICNYAEFGPHTKQQLCKTASGLLTTCGPRYYRPLHNALYRNLGGLRFADVTRASGALGAGKALGAAWADIDGSGMPTLAVANDEMPGDLLRPVARGAGLRYKNIAQVAGTAFNRDGDAYGGMGADWGDVDNDGKPDLFVATFQNEPKSLFHNDGGGNFTDFGLAAGLNDANRYVGFGCKFIDFDNDGWMDLAIANGHVQDNIDQIDHSTSYRQPMLLYHNLGGTGTGVRLENVTPAAGQDLQRPIVGRGLATGDYDNDGRMDMLIADAEGRPLVLHNECPASGHWLGVRLVGIKSNRDGYGAVLTARAGSRTWLQRCHADGSYMSSSDPRVHFGLAAVSRIDSLTVRWPSGRTDDYRNQPVDRYITLKEGDGAP